MKLWTFVTSSLYALRPAFSRKVTFFWFSLAVYAFCVRTDLAGVTSFVRCLGLSESCYHSFLGLFTSSGVKLDSLTRLWVQYVLEQAPLLKVEERVVILADGIKVPKEGRRMPGVKSLHQDSQSNAKSSFIMGHSIQALSVLCGTPSSAVAVPLGARIHEGLVESNRCKKTLLDRIIELLSSLSLGTDCLVVADAYYAAATVMFQLQAQGHHLLSRVQKNAVGFADPVPPPLAAKKRGRPKKYGKKIKLRTLFDNPEQFTSAASPVYGESKKTVQYLVRDLLWKPVKRKVRFVLVIHPERGRIILVTTDMSLDPLVALQTYGLRFKIEVSFKAAVHSIGTFSYHFWSGEMNPIKRKSGSQYLHKKPKKYRDTIKKKLRSYEVFIQTGLIAHGIINLIALKFPALTWKHFGSWIRTIRPGVMPSELVVKSALRNTLPQFIVSTHDYTELTEFLLERLDEERGEDLLRAA
jgi:hypothetical protein